MKLTSFGRSEILKILIGDVFSISIAVLIALYLNLVLACVLLVMIIIFSMALLAFFRDPIRIIPEDTDILVAPADGVIRDIEKLADCEECEFFDNKPVVRIGIFLSVLDVHINRAPCDVKIEKCVYRKGKYHDARNPLASKENEAMSVFCSASVEYKTFPLVVRQISGAIARRIVCVAKSGATFKKGERIGMIKFGSRTELVLPVEDWMEIKVHVGDRVFAGETIVAGIIKPIEKEDKL